MKIFKLSALGLAMIAVAGCNSEKPNEAAAKQAPPKIVSFITVQEAPLKIQSELKGRLAATDEAEVRPQVTGILKEIVAKDGSYVKQGDILYRVDPAQYEASYRQAVAALNSVQADIQTAKSKSERYAQLAKDKAIPQQEADEAMSAYQRLLSNLEERKAAVEMAQINLNYTTIKAPISGTLGITEVTKGALVTANQAASINSITKLNPIYLDVTQQSADFMKMVELGKQNGSKEIPVELSVGGNSRVFNGVVSSNELKVDPQTDTIKVRAKFSNEDNTLLPGMFGYAKITYAVQQNGIKVPMQTVMKDQLGKSYVYVVEEGTKIKKTDVEVLQSTSSEAIIASGLKNGDKIVFQGTDKIKDGDTVVAAPVQDKKE